MLAGGTGQGRSEGPQGGGCVGRKALRGLLAAQGGTASASLQVKKQPEKDCKSILGQLFLHGNATGSPLHCSAISDKCLLGLKQGQAALSQYIAVLGHPMEISPAASTKQGAALQQSSYPVLDIYLAAPELLQPVNFRFVDLWFVL